MAILKGKAFLLEVGMEEMPAKFAEGAVTQMETKAVQRLTELGLTYEGLRVYVTPRRLALYIETLATKQEDLEEEVRGPSCKAAYDEAGAPTKALLGFLHAQGVEPEVLFQRELKGTAYVYARKFRAGQPAEILLPDFARSLIGSLTFPKPMRWGNLDLRFVRPIRWLMALFGTEVVPFVYENLPSGRTSYGHRTVDGLIYLPTAQDYLAALRTAYVVADQAERRAIILAQGAQAVSSILGPEVRVEEDEALLTEVVHLVENPTVFCGRVEERYMELPEEVITTPMKEHQRYFPLRDAEGALLPYFLGVSNGRRGSLRLVISGNEKVLRARLADAAFYYEEDLKTPLPELVPLLDYVVYHDKLGSVGQRVQRLQRLASLIAEQAGLESAEKAAAARAALLAKADLVTKMVYDFPELQGIMGGYYARNCGEDQEVCLAVREHYQPRSTADDLPRSVVGRLVSLADKLDALVGFFSIGIQPTGSQDPFALRRQALGVAAILMAEDDASVKLRGLPINDLIEMALRVLLEQGTVAAETDAAAVEKALTDFFGQRIRYLLQEAGLAYDVIEAVMGPGGPYRLLCQARTLSGRREEATFIAYRNAYTRCVNLSKKETSAQDRWDLLTQPTEVALLGELETVGKQAAALAWQGDYDQAYAAASLLVTHIEALFEEVMIMDKDPAVRSARLALLSRCVAVLGCLGDLTLLAQ